MQGNWLLSVLTAVGLVAAASLLTLALAPFVPIESSPLFLIAVMISAYRGGYVAGFAATVLSVAADILMISPQWTFDVQPAELSRIGADVVASTLIGALSASRRKAEKERENLLLLERAAREDAERASSVKDEIVAVVSHELRTPLTTIKTLTHILRFKNPSEEERQEYLADIASETDRQIDLVLNLLDMSRIRAGGFDLNVTAVDLPKVLQECLRIERIEAAARRHEVVFRTENGLPPVKGDKSALRRSVCTMIENAIKYTPDGGRIEVGAESRPNGEIAVSIRDNGRGIHPQDMPYIFDRFFRGHLRPVDGQFHFGEEQEVEGIGLGLPLAQVLCQSMDGRIEVDSEVGRGSTFTILLKKWDPYGVARNV